MMRAAVAEARAFDSWSDYQEALKRAIAPLGDEQLRQRPFPGRRTPGEVAEHIVFGRALHLQGALGDEAQELADLVRWDQPDDPPRTATEIVEGLERTWRVLSDRLMRGSAADVLPAEDATAVRTIWGLLDHDLPHAGQLSLLLVAIGVPGVDI